MKAPIKNSNSKIKFSASWNKHLDKFQSREFWKRFRRDEKSSTKDEANYCLNWHNQPDFYYDEDDYEEYDQIIYESEWEDFNYDLIERIGDRIKYKRYYE